MQKILVVLLISAVDRHCGLRQASQARCLGRHEHAAVRRGYLRSGLRQCGGGDTGEGTEIAGPQEGLLAKRIIYFDFDSSEIRGEGTEIVAAHAKHLAGAPA